MRYGRDFVVHWPLFFFLGFCPNFTRGMAWSIKLCRGAWFISRKLQRKKFSVSFSRKPTDCNAKCFNPTSTETVPPESARSTPASHPVIPRKVHCGQGMLRSMSPCPPPASEVSSAWGHAQVWLQLWVRANQVRHRGTDARQPDLVAPETSSHILASQCCFSLPPKACCWGLGCRPPLTLALMPPHLHLLSVQGKPQLLAPFSSKGAVGTVPRCTSSRIPIEQHPLPPGCLGGSGCCLVLWRLSLHPRFFSFGLCDPHTPALLAFVVLHEQVVSLYSCFPLALSLPGTPLKAFLNWRSH